jgi:hypothetical protein
MSARFGAVFALQGPVLSFSFVLPSDLVHPWWRRRRLVFFFLFIFFLSSAFVLVYTRVECNVCALFLGCADREMDFFCDYNLNWLQSIIPIVRVLFPD